jgi:hypothetical protein
MQFRRTAATEKHRWVQRFSGLLHVVLRRQELPPLLDGDEPFVLARVAAHPAGAFGQIVIPAQCVLSPELSIVFVTEHTTAESPLDHPLSMMTSNRSFGRFHSLSSEREHTPIGVLPVP